MIGYVRRVKALEQLLQTDGSVYRVTYGDHTSGRMTGIALLMALLDAEAGIPARPVVRYELARGHEPQIAGLIAQVGLSGGGGGCAIAMRP